MSDMGAKINFSLCLAGGCNLSGEPRAHMCQQVANFSHRPFALDKMSGNGSISPSTGLRRENANG